MNDYQIYLDYVKTYLTARKKRLLTPKEEEVVIAHLEAKALFFCLKYSKARDEGDAYEGLGMTETLAVETAVIVSKIHPDFPSLTPAQFEQKTKEVLAIRNFLKTDELSLRDNIEKQRCHKKRI